MNILEVFSLVSLFLLRHDVLDVGTHILSIEVRQQGGGAVPPSNNLSGGADSRGNLLRRCFTGRALAVVIRITPESGVGRARNEL